MEMIFQYFFVWEIGKIKRRFLQSAFVKRLLKALFIFIYHISAFLFETMIHCFSIQNWEISIQKWRFLHSNLFRSVSNLLFWNLSVFFSSAFSPFGMEKSPFRMEISPWRFLHFKLFHTRVMNLFFWNVSFFFLPDHFLNSEWRILLLTSELRFLHAEWKFSPF